MGRKRRPGFRTGRRSRVCNGTPALWFKTHNEGYGHGAQKLSSFCHLTSSFTSSFAHLIQSLLQRGWQTGHSPGCLGLHVVKVLIKVVCHCYWLLLPSSLILQPPVMCISRNKRQKLTWYGASWEVITSCKGGGDAVGCLFLTCLFVGLFVGLLLYVQYNLVWMNFGEIAWLWYWFG